MERELLALLIEVTSVAAAGKQLRKPITLPRPKRRRAKPTTPAQVKAAYSQGIAVLHRTRNPRAVGR